MGSTPVIFNRRSRKVQRRAARWVKADYRMTSSVTMMLNDLKWSTLQKRRQESRLSMFFKFLCQDSTPLEIPLHYQHITNYPTRNYHPLHLMIPSSHTLFYQKSYFPRSIVEWNRLPPHIIESKSLLEFTNNLHSWLDQTI